jgi:F-type H+-transporting ATPase subunit b
MDVVLRQLGELLLGSVPTIIFMVLLYLAYHSLVHKPLVKVLAERRAKTEGAVEKAHADIAAAEARTAEYEQRLREARLAVFKGQEARRQQATQARAAAQAEARSRAQAQVEQARTAIEKDKVAAQEKLQAESGKLAAEVIRIVLRPGSSPSRAGVL